MDKEQSIYSKFCDLVPDHLRCLSGSVFYSGSSAFSTPSEFYFLGLNPGGDPLMHNTNSVGKDISQALKRSKPDWSAYIDERWSKTGQDYALMQRNVQYLCKKLGLKPRHVPASNLIFQRSSRENSLEGNRTQLIKDCWPFHAAVIDKLNTRVIICFGHSAGRYVRAQLNAIALIDTFIEMNNRRWTSNAYKNSENRLVITLAHPGVVHWEVNASDPTNMVKRSVLATSN